MTANLGIVFK